MSNRIIEAIRLQSFVLGSLKRSGLFKELVLFVFSTISYQGSRFAVGLIAASFLGPQVYGLWTALSLILVYGGVTGLGIPNAMNRDVPFLKGRKDLQGAEKIRRVAWGAILCTSLASGVVLIIIASFPSIPSSLKFPLRWLAMLLVASQLYGYLQFYLKSNLLFASMSYQQFIFSVFFPIITVPLIIFYGLSGYIAGQALAAILISCLIVKLVPFSFRPEFDLHETLRLAKIGVPIMAVGLLYSLLTTIDRWVILTFLGVRELGYYSLAIMVESVVSLIPFTIAQQIYPRMAETFGSVSNYSSLKTWITLQILMSTVATAPLLVGLYFLFPPFVYKLLPDYAPGITAAQIVLVGILFLPLSGGFSNFLNTVGKQVYNMMAQGVAVLINLGLNISFAQMGLGINGIALGTTIAYISYGLITLLIGNRILKSSYPGRKHYSGHH